MKGRGAVRFKVDCRKRVCMERVKLVMSFYPQHYLHYGHGHYLSPEALNEPIEFLRATPKDRTHGCGQLPIDKFLKEVRKSATKHFLKNENELSKNPSKNQKTQ